MIYYLVKKCTYTVENQYIRVAHSWLKSLRRLQEMEVASRRANPTVSQSRGIPFTPRARLADADKNAGDALIELIQLI